MIFNDDDGFRLDGNNLTPEEIEMLNAQEEQSAVGQVMNLLFGGPSLPGNPQVQQAAVPNPKNIIPQILNFARSANLGAGKQLSKLPGALGNIFKAGGKAVNNPVSGKFVPNATVTQGIKTAGQGVANLASKPFKLAGDMGKAAVNNPKTTLGGLAAITAAGIVPGAQDAVNTGVGVSRALSSKLFGSKEDPEATEERGQVSPSIPGIPSPRQEVIDEVSTRAGVNILPEGPEGDRARELQGFEARRQAQADVALRQSSGINRLQEQEKGIVDERQNIAEQIAGLRQASNSSGQDEFGGQLASLLAIGLPSALIGSRQGLDAAFQNSDSIASSAARGRSEQAAKLDALQDRADKLLNTNIMATKGVIESEGALGAQLTKESAAFKENVEQTRKLEDEGRLDPTRRRQVGSTRWDHEGLHMGDQSLYRPAGAKAMNSNDEKKFSAIVSVQPTMEHNLRTFQKIINKVGVTGDAAFSEPVTIIDPTTGKEKEFTNGAAAMQTLSTIFKAQVKDLENLGALGEDVLQFTGKMIADPIGYFASLKDLNGNVTGQISQQIDVMVEDYARQKDTFFNAHEIRTAQSLDEELLDRGEVQGFSRLPKEQIDPRHPERTIKMVDPEDGKVFLLTPQEYSKVLQKHRRKGR